MELNEVYKAKERLKPIIRKTPLILSSASSKCNLYIKPENLQLTGSFKIRGAYNKISTLTKEEKAKGIITCSAGNHAQGVAFSAKKFGVNATICMPKSTAEIKIRNTEKYGAKVVLCDGNFENSNATALRLQEENGYCFIHPFNDEKVIAGQGTIALEILEELPKTDIIICPVGGGGLISGISFVAKSINPNIKVYGIQSKGALGMFSSVVYGNVLELTNVHTLAEGIAVGKVGSLTFEYTEKYVDDIFYVSDDDIFNAIKFALTDEKLLLEGAGAASLASVIKGCIPNLKNKNVVTIASGGNIDLSLLVSLLKAHSE